MRLRRGLAASRCEHRDGARIVQVGAEAAERPGGAVGGSPEGRAPGRADEARLRASGRLGDQGVDVSTDAKDLDVPRLLCTAMYMYSYSLLPTHFHIQTHSTHN